jgi:hypothetical protein
MLLLFVHPVFPSLRKWCLHGCPPFLHFALAILPRFQTNEGIYVLQEIYGIAGTAAGPSDDTKREVDGTGDAPAGADREEETGRADCVVCLTNKRELAILPCRHMCVCRACAAECIQNQDSKCPICRNRKCSWLKKVRGKYGIHSAGSTS